MDVDSLVAKLDAKLLDLRGDQPDGLVLAYYLDGSWDDAVTAVQQWFPDLSSGEWSELADHLLSRWDDAQYGCKRQARMLGTFGAMEIAKQHKRRAVARASCDSFSSVEFTGAPPVPGKRIGKNWPTRSRRKLTDGHTAEARAEAEALERGRWVQAAVEIVVEAKLPLSEVAAGDEKFLAAVGQGLRVGTLRMRVREWRRARSYFMATWSVVWPIKVQQVLEYMHSLAECMSLSTINSFVMALAFFEKGGGVQAGYAFHDHPLVKGAARDLLAKVQEGKPVRQAPPQLMSVTAARECAVCDEAEPRYVRMYQWWLLIKLWGTLRFDDHRGLQPSSMRMDSGGIHGTITRSKTTGPGKRISALPLFVSMDAWLVEPGWLKTGWELWQDLNDNRDFFLCMPGPDLVSARLVETTYKDALPMSRLAFGRLSGAGGARLQLIPDVATFWTEHSDRATLPSWAAATGMFATEWVDMLGRWAPSRSETYVRTHRVRVQAIQQQVAMAVRNKESRLLEAEGLVLDQLKEYLQQHGSDGVQIERQMLQFAAWVDTPSARSHAVNHSPPANNLDLEADVPVDTGGDAECSADLGTYYVSIQPRTGFRRLHVVGGCHRKPGVHVMSFEAYGDELPDAAAYHDYCRNCWPGRSGPLAEEVSSNFSASSSTDDGPAL
eukprot:4691285-Amphidinium_carterae.1